MAAKYKILTIIGVLIGSLNVQAASSNYLFTRGESFSYSAANPVTAYLDFLVGPAPDDGNHAFTRNSIEFGMGYKNFEFSLIHRNDQNLDFSDGARVFAYRNKNRVNIPLDEYYDVDVWGNQYQASGIKFANTWHLSKTVKFTAAYSYLIGTEIVSGYLGKDEQGMGGQVAYTMRNVNGSTRRALDGALHTDIYYNSDPFFRRSVDAPTSVGFAFDVGFEWQLRRDLTLTGKIDDLSGELHWKDVPHTVADVTGDMFKVDDEGFIEAQPSHSGTEDWGDYVQKLTRRERWFLNYERGHHQFGYGFDHYLVKDFHRLVYAYVRDSQWGGRISIETTTSAVELALLMPKGTLSFTFDDTNLDYAHTIGLVWNLNFQF